MKFPGLSGVLASMALLASAAPSAFAHGSGEENAEVDLIINTPDEPVGVADGLAAWERLYAVTSHPRCSNCHVDERNIPMWSGPSYGETRPHGMNIHAGASRIGAEHLPCATCHITSAAPNTVAHAAPHTGHPWLLAPAEFAWFGKESAEVCRQMRDPQRNGGRDGAGLVEHIIHDAEIKAFITWGFNPGGGRDPAPGTMQAHLDDMVLWTTAGMPCQGDAPDTQ